MNIIKNLSRLAKLRWGFVPKSYKGFDNRVFNRITNSQEKSPYSLHDGYVTKKELSQLDLNEDNITAALQRIYLALKISGAYQPAINESMYYLCFIFAQAFDMSETGIKD